MVLMNLTPLFLVIYVFREIKKNEKNPNSAFDVTDAFNELLNMHQPVTV